GYTWAGSPGPEPLWIGGLSGVTATTRNGWSATVTVLAADGEGPLSGVAVSGSWSTGSGSTSCTTGVDGRCSLTDAVGRKSTTVTFSVSGLSKTGWTY